MHDSQSTFFIIKYIRKFLAGLDIIVYSLVDLSFSIFFNLAKSDFVSKSNFLQTFYGRLQLLIGIFVVFKLAMNLISGLVDPDKVSDKKSGTGNIIIRVMSSLAMLTLIFPLSGIPDYAAPDGSFNRYLKNQGILFGTLSSLQQRLIDGNVLGKLILGASGTETDGSVSNAAYSVTTSVAQGFVVPNGKKSDVSKWVCNGKKITADGSFGSSGSIDDYYNSGYVGVFVAAGRACPDDADNYQFAYMFPASTIVGIFCVYVVISFSIDVAVRLIKLTILRFLAPIPIIAYIDPKTEEMSFKPWLKMLGSTYLDLFLRLGLIYFVIFMCRLIVTERLDFASSSVVINFLSTAIIVVALLYFAKQAPKFIKDIFGIKDSGSFFGSLGAVAGIGTGIRYARQRYKEANEKNPDHTKRNKAKALVSGIVGGVTGAVAGMEAAGKADGLGIGAGFDAATKKGNIRETGSTFFGRTLGKVNSATGYSKTAKMDNQIANNEQFANMFDVLDKRIESDGVNRSYLYSGVNHGTGQNALGRNITNIKEEMDILKNMKSSDQYSIDDKEKQEKIVKEMKAKLYEGISYGRYAEYNADYNALEDSFKSASDYNGAKYANAHLHLYGQLKGDKFDASNVANSIKNSTEYRQAKKQEDANK